MEIVHTFYNLPEVTLHAATAGDKDGEVLLFLHGFPEFWYGWHKQLHFFAAQGYHVVAPDLRGYNLSSKPSGVKAYTLEKVAGDVVALISQLGKKKVVLVGHDWGGMVAWTVAMYFPHLLHKLVILNIPHPAVLQQHLRKNQQQMLRSWYMGFFQLPVLPEMILQAQDYKLLAQALTGTSKRNAFSDAELTAYKAAWRQQGALTGMLNWYRAFKYSELNLNKAVRVPTLMLWGKRDTALGSEMAEPSIARCAQGKLVFLEKATHWLHHEEPEKVNQKILFYLRNNA